MVSLKDGCLKQRFFYAGLTELADRFPEDFTSLMKTFHAQQSEGIQEAQFLQPHDTKSRDISPMEILNLANMITQVGII